MSAATGIATATQPASTQPASTRPASTRPDSTTSVASAGQPRLRLTRRGRAVITTLVAIPLAIVAGSFVLTGGVATASNVEGADVSFVQVDSGESLWELAAGLAPDADPREVVSDLVHFNQLDSADVQPGQKLAIPSAYVG